MTDTQRLVTLQRTLYQSRNPTRRYLHCARRDWVQRMIQRCAKARLGGIGVEIGPGSGVYLAMLATATAQVLAVDREYAYLRAARDLATDANGGSSTSYVQGDLRQPPLAPASVDLLLCSEVIEHVEDSPALLQALADLLAPGGRLILTTPQPLSPLELLGKIAFLPGVIHLLRWIYREPVEPTGHINLLSRRRLENQISDAGLTVIRRDVLGLYLPVIAEFGGVWGQRLLARLEPVFRRPLLRSLLWTQCYLVQRSP